MENNSQELCTGRVGRFSLIQVPNRGSHISVNLRNEERSRIRYQCATRFPTSDHSGIVVASTSINRTRRRALPRVWVHRHAIAPIALFWAQDPHPTPTPATRIPRGLEWVGRANRLAAESRGQFHRLVSKIVRPRGSRRPRRLTAFVGQEPTAGRPTFSAVSPIRTGLASLRLYEATISRASHQQHTSMSCFSSGFGERVKVRCSWHDHITRLIRYMTTNGPSFWIKKHPRAF